MWRGGGWETEIEVKLTAQKGFVCLLSSWMPEFFWCFRTILITMFLVYFFIDFC